MIKTYETDAAHAAAAKSAIESAVVLIESSNEIVTDGVNVITNNPKVGDILVLDESNKKRFIALDTFQMAIFPKAWTIVGVVAVREGNKVICVHKSNAGKAWSAIFKFKVTGWNLDGAQHTTNITFYSSQTPAADPAFNYAGTDYATIAAQLNTWFDGYKATSGLRYHAIALEDGIRVQIEPYNTWYQYVLSMSGLTVTQMTGAELPASSTLYRKTGLRIDWFACNLVRYMQWAKTSGSVPTSNVPLSTYTGHAVKIADFNTSAFCELLRKTYCKNPSAPTEDDYLAYIKGEYSGRVPDQRGALAPKFTDGHDNTYKLAGSRYVDYNGVEQIEYPAFDYCADVAYNADGLTRGCWYLPSNLELTKIMRGITYGHSGVSRDKADPVNRSLNAIGGSAISCASYVWSSSRCNVGNAWNFGGNGHFSNNSFSFGLACVPCVLLTLNESEA